MAQAQLNNVTNILLDKDDYVIVDNEMPSLPSSTGSPGKVTPTPSEMPPPLAPPRKAQRKSNYNTRARHLSVSVSEAADIAMPPKKKRMYRTFNPDEENKENAKKTCYDTYPKLILKRVPLQLINHATDEEHDQLVNSLQNIASMAISSSQPDEEYVPRTLSNTPIPGYTPTPITTPPPGVSPITQSDQTSESDKPDAPQIVPVENGTPELRVHESHRMTLTYEGPVPPPNPVRLSTEGNQKMKVVPETQLQPFNFRYQIPEGYSPQGWERFELPGNHFSEFNDCIHQRSFMDPIMPNELFSNPYHPSMVTMLRAIKTTPNDLYSPTKPRNPRNAMKILASYQQHWDPKMNVPVLTIVAPCGTTLSQPFMVRNKPRKIDLSFTASTEGEQRMFLMEVPLSFGRTSAVTPVVLTSGPSNNMPDTYTSYLVRSVTPHVNLLWIKVFQMSVMGCRLLHLQSIYNPPRPARSSEYHLLALNGHRITTYEKHHLPVDHHLIQKCTPEDLEAMKYDIMQSKTTTSLYYNPQIVLCRNPLMQQQQFQEPSYYLNVTDMCIPKKSIIPISVVNMVPIYYPVDVFRMPPLKKPNEVSKFFSQSLTPGVVRKDKLISARMYISRITPLPNFNIVETFLRYHPVNPKAFEDLTNLDLPIETFLHRFRHTYGNDVCQYKQLKSQHEPFDVSIPKSWRYIADHPFIEDDAERHEYPATEDHDWPSS